MDDVINLETFSETVETCATEARVLAAGFDPEKDDFGLADLQAVAKRLKSLVAQISHTEQVVQDVQARVQRAAEARYQRTRFTPAALAVRMAEIRELAISQPRAATTSFLSEIAAALNALKVAPAMQLVADAPSSLPLPSGLAQALVAWEQGDLVEGRKAVGELSELARKERAPSGVMRQLAVVGAWLDHRTGDPTSARMTLDDLLRDVAPSDATAYAERAGLALILGEGDVATALARRGIELQPDDGRPYLQLGAASETEGDYRDAIELYEEGCRRLDRLGVADIGSGATFLQPTGLLHLARARRLADLAEIEAALKALDDAIGRGIAGESSAPDADAYELRFRVLQRMNARPLEAAQAALDAGRRLWWNGAPERATPCLEFAVQARPPLDGAGWFLAMVQLSAAWTSPAAPPDPEPARQAKHTWDDWYDLVGPPNIAAAWAYPIYADICEVIADAGDEDVSDTTWMGIMLCEKALVIDPQQSYAWGDSSRLLRRLGVEALALEAADAGFAINPDELSVLQERLALLGNAGRFDEALETLHRMPTSPWLAGVESWLLLHQGHPDEAIPHLDLPLSGSDDLGYYLDLRVTCYLRIGRVVDAIADLRRLLEVDIGKWGPNHTRRAWARAVFGELDTARRELDAACHDESIAGHWQEGAVGACIALVAGEHDNVLHRLQNALAAAPNRRSVQDIEWLLQDCATLAAYLGHAPTKSDILPRVAALIEGWRPQSDFVSPDEELARITEQHRADASGSYAPVALASIRARRLRGRGGLDEATATYAGLRASAFEPEATVALGDVLVQRLEKAIAAGDVEGTKEPFKSLESLGRAPQPFLELVTADALRAAGRLAEAIATLSGIAAHATAAADRLAIRERLGELALQAGDVDLADTSFQAAVAAATELDDPVRVAQLHVRLAVTSALKGSTDAVTAHLSKALAKWGEAGRVDPLSILNHEITWAIKSAKPSDISLSDVLWTAARVAGHSST